MMDTCSLTDEEFIHIINVISIRESSEPDAFNRVESMHDSLILDRLDSLGVMMLVVWLHELFGITTETVPTRALKGDLTVDDLFTFVKKYQTKGYTYAQIEQTLVQISK
jgi:acyl carrier protein